MRAFAAFILLLAVAVPAQTKEIASGDAGKWGRASVTAGNGKLTFSVSEPCEFHPGPAMPHVWLLGASKDSYFCILCDVPLGWGKAYLGFNLPWLRGLKVHTRVAAWRRCGQFYTIGREFVIRT